MCCPGLEWAGPTRDELLTYHKNRIHGDWAEVQSRRVSGEDLEKCVRDEWQKVQSGLRNMLNRTCTPREANLYKSYFQRLELLENEPVLRAEADDMIQNGSVRDILYHYTGSHLADMMQKFSIATLSHRNGGGLEEWIVQKTNQMTEKVAAKKANPAEIKP